MNKPTPYTIVGTKTIQDREWSAIRWNLLPKSQYQMVMTAVYEEIPDAQYSRNLKMLFVPLERMEDFKEIVYQELVDIEDLEEAFAGDVVEEA